MGYLPAVIVAAVGVVLLVVLVAVVLRRARRASRAAGGWQGDVRVATSRLRADVEEARHRRAGHS